LLNIWMRVFGTSEAGIRSLSALLGIAALWFMYQVTNELLNESTGLISLLILGLAPFHVYYSQEARPYALQMVLLLLSTYLFIKVVFSDEGHWGYWVGYILTALLAVNSHYFSLFIYFQHNLFLLLCRRPLFFSKRWLGGQAALLVVAIPPLFTLIPADEWFRRISAPPLWQAFPYTLARFTFADYANELLHRFRMAFVFSALLFSGLFSLGVWSLLKNHGKEKCLFLLTWLCVPIVLLVINDIIGNTKAWMISRYLMTASLAYYIILAAGITGIKKPYLRAALLSGVIAVFALCVIQCFKQPKPEQWQEAMQYINENPSQADLLLFYPRNLAHITNYYVQRPIPLQVIHPGKVSEIGNNHRDLNGIVVIIRTIDFDVTPKDLNQIVDYLSTDHNLVHIGQWTGVKILRFERKTPFFR